MAIAREPEQRRASFERQLVALPRACGDRNDRSHRWRRALAARGKDREEPAKTVPRRSARMRTATTTLCRGKSWERLRQLRHTSKAASANRVANQSERPSLRFRVDQRVHQREHAQCDRHRQESRRRRRIGPRARAEPPPWDRRPKARDSCGFRKPLQPTRPRRP